MAEAIFTKDNFHKVYRRWTSNDLPDPDQILELILLAFSIFLVFAGWFVWTWISAGCVDVPLADINPWATHLPVCK